MWFVFHDKVSNFHIWILSYHQPFHNKIKRQKSLELFAGELWCGGVWRTKSYNWKHNFAPVYTTCVCSTQLFLLKQVIGQWSIWKLLKNPCDCVCIWRNLASNKSFYWASENLPLWILQILSEFRNGWES